MVTMQNPLAQQAHTINDGVMGGRSSSRIQITPEGVQFSGVVSLANNGGFASMRGQWPYNVLPQQQTVDCIQLTLKGDGKCYQFRLFTAENSDGSAYVYSFATKATEITFLAVPLTAFSARFRGQFISKPKLKLEHIREYGLLIGDKQEGAFSLVLKEIKLMES